MNIDVENINLDNVIKDLGFEVSPYTFRGQETNLLEISRNNRFVSIVSDRYKLLPNELAEAISDEVSKRVFAEKDIRIPVDNGIICQYIMEEIQVEDDNGSTFGHVYPGFYMTNSIDNRMSFRIKSFLQYNNESIYLGTLVSGIIRRHTKNIELILGRVIDRATKAVEISELFANTLPNFEKISVVQGEGIGIMESIRASNIPNIYRPPYLLKPTKRVKEEEIPGPPHNLNLFDMYMHVIHSLNHPPTGELSEKTKINYMDMLHKSMKLSIEEEGVSIWKKI